MAFAGPILQGVEHMSMVGRDQSNNREPDPLPWVSENPDPDLSAVPADLLRRLCAAGEMDNRDPEAADSLIFWAITLADRHGVAIDALPYDDVVLWIRTVALQLLTEEMHRKGLVVRSGEQRLIPPTNALPVQLPIN